jgi:hypothetical protein
MKKISLLLLFVFALSTMLFADEVFLKGAGSISGKIVEQTDTMVTVDVGGGTMGVMMSRVERIVKERHPLDDYAERASKLGPEDLNGWRKLARWAEAEGLSAQSRQAYKQVLVIAPNDKEANDALGFVQLNGRWVTVEESYLAQGYVKYEGEWMTPAAAQMFQQSAAAAQAAEEAGRAARLAEADQMLAENRAAKAEEKAAEEKARADREARWGPPVNLGGWGYGVTTWPTTNNNYWP